MRKFFAETIFWIHAFFVSLWYGLFFIPTDWWPGKILFHFNFSLFVVLHQFIWGALITPWTRKYRMVCFLTTITQFLRGKKISDPNNYNHSFSREFLNKGGIVLSHRRITILTLLTLTIVSIQYLLFYRLKSF
jgi:hypothetical protein